MAYSRYLLVQAKGLGKWNGWAIGGWGSGKKGWGRYAGEIGGGEMWNRWADRNLGYSWLRGILVMVWRNDFV